MKRRRSVILVSLIISIITLWSLTPSTYQNKVSFLETVSQLESIDERCFEYFHQGNAEIQSHDNNTAAEVLAAETRHLRVFNRCFLEDSKRMSKWDKASKISEKTTHFLSNIDHLKSYITEQPTSVVGCEQAHPKLFPYLKQNLPIYRRWTGDILYDIPNYEAMMPSHISLEDADFDNNFGKLVPHHQQCLVQYIKHNANGKGIVITVNGKQASQAAGLIRVLRALNNTLPVEIVHTGLSSYRVKEIVTAARAPREASNKVTQLPKLDVWFVDVSQSLASDSLSKGYSMKIVALVLSSFSDTILLDADTVPLVPITEFFSSKQYNETQTYFFQDRSDLKFNILQHTQLLSSLMPADVDTNLFGIPAATDSTFANRFMKSHFYYFMEAGVVVINRKAHFGGILMALQLAFWEPVFKDMLWGDKELYWLGLSMAGDEVYAFNSLDAAAVGELSKSPLFPSSKSKEVCSIHPGQISDNDNKTLLWINKGFHVCDDMNTLTWDLKQSRYKGLTRKELRRKYSENLNIEAAVIPPLVLQDNFVEDEPERGWKQLKFCNGYMWCAQSEVANEMKGTVVEFSEQKKEIYRYLGETWN